MKNCVSIYAIRELYDYDTIREESFRRLYCIAYF